MVAVTADTVVIVVCLRGRGRNLSFVRQSESLGSPEGCSLSPFIRPLSLTSSRGGHIPLIQGKGILHLYQIQHLHVTHTPMVPDRIALTWHWGAGVHNALTSDISDKLGIDSDQDA